MEKALIIYHGIDLDGKGSAYIAYNGLQDFEKFDSNNIDFQPYNYEGLNYLDYHIEFEKYKRVICVDISIPIETIKSFKKDTYITIIDHHELDDKYVNKLNKLNIQLVYSKNTSIDNYKFNKPFAAIQLTWKYFYGRKYGNKTPIWVDLLGDYDRWYNENLYYWESRVMPFQMFVRSLDTEPLSDDWKKLDISVKEDLMGILKIGRFIWNYDKNIRKETIDNFAYEKRWEGLRAIICNSSLRGSQLFDSIYNENNYDIMIVYNFNGEEYIYSIYSTKDNIDCSEIAKKYGGGGHKGAAGFRSKTRII